MRSMGLFTFLILTPLLSAADTDWPAFRGPNRDNISPDKGLLKSWPKAGPKQLWKISGLGKGYSSVVIVGKRIFTMGDLDNGCYVFALDRATGKEIWKTKIGTTGGNFEGPRCTPTVDGDSVYALGQFGDLVCLDVATGKARWSKNLEKDFKGSSGGWNYTESPLIDGDKLICTPGGRQATMVALNKKTGAVIWQGVVGANGDTAGYSSIIIAEIGGIKQYVQLMANGLVGFSADKGKLLWSYGNNSNRFGGNTANIPTPIVKGDQVFASAGYGRGAAMLSFSSSGGKFDVKENYWVKEMNNKHGGITLVGDKLFGDRDDRGQPWCADFATGKFIWQREDRGDGSASMTHADGKLFIRYQNGRVALVDAEANSYKELGSFKIQGAGEDSWPHPVVIGGRLYLREKENLFCYDVKGK